jgi:Uma2 family endonuclease
MNVVLPQKISIEQFLVWAEQQSEGRYELVGGKVVMMAPERVGHVRAKGRVYTALTRAMAASKIVGEVFTDGVGIRTGGEFLREPDASVQLGDAVDADVMILDSPCIVVEVLSPSSVATDTVDKLEEYFSVPSIRHYLIVNNAKRSVTHHSLSDDASIKTVIYHDGTIDFLPFGFSVDVVEFFGEANS